MNILHLGKYYPPYHGGMEHYLQDLAEAQVEQGHQVTVMVHNHEFGKLLSQTKTEHVNGVKVIRLKSTRPICFTPLMIGLGRTLNQLLKENKFDILHLHWPNPSLALLLFNKASKNLPWVLRWHSDMVTESSSKLLKFIYALIKPIEQAIIKRSQLILCSSPVYIEQAPALLKNREKCHVLPLGIKPMLKSNDQLPTEWAEQQWPKNKLRLFNLGRLTFYKNQKLLIEASIHHQSQHTLIAGSGQLKAQLEKQIKKNKLQENIKLLGNLSWPKVNALYQSCDVFCLTSNDRAESFGVVLLEAMWHNKIILVADTLGSGMSWLAQQYNKGFIFKSNDAHDFIKKLNHIEENLGSIQALPENFQWPINQTASDLNHLYKKIKKETP
ncbi:glycosyltransferase [Marinicella rhabdoformis]|uniref:glycosyltransferase n=1 Tax=Marinicella rhabdoformis TaxID=2580566 RepID=UPI0015D05226|nr:glycosyltransferase [Marinicella rhabdoformis]